MPVIYDSKGNGELHSGVSFQFPPRGDRTSKIDHSNANNLTQTINFDHLPQTCKNFPRWMAAVVIDDVVPQPSYILPMDEVGTPSLDAYRKYLQETIPDKDLEKLHRDNFSVPSCFAIALREGIIDVNQTDNLIFQAIVLLRRPSQLTDKFRQFGVENTIRSHNEVLQEGFSPAQEGFDDTIRILARERPDMAHTSYPDQERLFVGVNQEEPDKRFEHYVDFLRRTMAKHRLENKPQLVKKFETVAIGGIIATIADGQQEKTYELLKLFDKQHLFTKTFGEKGIAVSEA